MEFMALLILCSLLLAARPAVASNAAVLDSDGKELQRGQRYYARSVMRPGGGLTLAALNGSCPLNVVQARFSDLLGRPLAFFPENPNNVTVPEGYTLNIMFPEPTQCPESTVWKLDGETGRVTTGGSASTSIGTNFSRFALRRVDDSFPDYQIEVCPCSVGSGGASCRMGCLGPLGIEVEGRNRVLGINSDRPHIIQFVKIGRQENSMLTSAVKSQN